MTHLNLQNWVQYHGNCMKMGPPAVGRDGNIPWFTPRGGGMHRTQLDNEQAIPVML
jgi:hypothetical protein